MREVRERLLSCTRAEFTAWLAAHTGQPAPFAAGCNVARVPVAGGEIEIEVTELPPRRIALLQLPQLGVRMSFPAAAADAATAWIERFGLYTQRGGG
jgi:hypothetical protein